MIVASAAQKNIFTKSCEATLRQQEVVPYERGSVFAERYFQICSEAKGATTGKWTCRPWQREILDVYNSIEHSGVFWLKPSRTGASKMLAATMVQSAVQHKFNFLTYHPDDGDSEFFVKTEIDPMLREIDVLQPLKLYNSKKFDTLSYKQMLGASWHFLGGNTPKHYRGRTVDIVALDELAGFAPKIGKDGDALYLSGVRITESPFGKQIGQSSPLEMPGCQITRAIENCHFVFKFYVPCPKCGKHAYIDFYEDGSKGVRWNQETKNLSTEERANTACYRCEHCEEDSTYAETQDAQEGGQWRTEDGKHWLDKGRVMSDAGHHFEKRWRIGFVSNCFISPAYTFENFAEDYINAQRQMNSGSEGPMISIHQTRLGRAWHIDQTVTNIDYRTIQRNNVMDYPEDGTIPAPILAVVSTVDVQGDRLELMDWGIGEGEEMFALKHIVLPGAVTQPDVWESLADYWYERTYMTEDERELPIYLHGIDHGGHWTEAVERFCMEMGPREFLAIKGRLGIGEPVAKFPRRPQQSGCWLVTNNTDPAKLTILKRLPFERDPELWVNPGCISFPMPVDGYENFDERFYRQLTSESRIIRPNGKPEWKVKGRNEIFDLTHMALNLTRVAQMPQYGLILKNTGNVGLQKPKRARRYNFAAMGASLNTA